MTSTSAELQTTTQLVQVKLDQNMALFDEWKKLLVAPERELARRGGQEGPSCFVDEYSSSRVKRIQMMIHQNLAWLAKTADEHVERRA